MFPAYVYNQGGTSVMLSLFFETLCIIRDIYLASSKFICSVTSHTLISRYLLKLFEECILERFSEQDPAKLMSSLVSLMRIWEKSVSSKGIFPTSLFIAIPRIYQ